MVVLNLNCPAAAELGLCDVVPEGNFIKSVSSLNPKRFLSNLVHAIYV